MHHVSNFHHENIYLYKSPMSGRQGKSATRKGCWRKAIVESSALLPPEIPAAEDVGYRKHDVKL